MMLQNYNYNNVWWVAVAGAFGLAGERLNNSIIKQKRIVVANNKVKLQREKFHHQRRLDAARERQERVEKTVKIYENYNKNVYTREVRDDLLNQINSPAPLWSEELRTPTNQKNDGSKFASVTFSNSKKNLSNKQFTTEISRDEYFYPHEFEEASSMSVFSLLIPLCQGILFGLALKILLEVLYITFFKKTDN